MYFRGNRNDYYRQTGAQDTDAPVTLPVDSNELTNWPCDHAVAFKITLKK